MDLGDDRQRDELKRRLGDAVRGRKVVVGLLPLAAATSWVNLLADVGARRPLVVATGRGAGPVPTEQQAEVVVIDTPHRATMTEELRDQDRIARHLPPEARAAVEAYDPDGEALWMMGPFVVNEPVLGRPVLGGRPASWLALEDKLLAEQVWEAVDARHVAARVVPVEPALLDAAAQALDLGHGTVWAGDARDGFNGGGEFTRWVVSARDRAQALAFFAPRCDRVRVMPFLEGVPCSIHGIVLPGGTAAFRPVELAILRSPGRQFVYGGQGTSWDPPAADREEMRELVRRTGEHLRAGVGYRGGFGIDGILTRDGFRPTEINTRAAGGLVLLFSGLDGAFLTLLQLACVAGEAPGVTVAELEDWAVTAMDTQRLTKPLAISHRSLTEHSTDIPVRWEGGALLPDPDRRDDGEGPRVLVGPSAQGSYCRLDGLRMEPGERVGPLNVELMGFLDRHLGAGFGEVSAPPDVRGVVAAAG